MSAATDRGPADLAQTLSAVARDLQAASGEEATLEGIVRAAVATVPGIAYGGISQVSDGGKVTAKVPSHELVRKCDEIQSELGEGPCMDAIWQQHTVIVDDMAAETRWPRFAARAAELGVGSMISFQLYVDGTLGALNLYGETGMRFGDDAQIIGELFASHAAIALSGARTYRQMDEALATRDVIGQAKGLLMQRENVTGLQAFDMLVRASQHANLKLNEVARWIVDEHENPGQPHRPHSR